MKKILTLIPLLLITILLSAQTIDPNYETQKKSIIKMEFFSPLVDHTTFGYERYIKDWVSWEAKVGFIGLGVSNGDNTDPRGVLFRAGPKFKLNPDFVTRDLRGSHLLGGKYIKPEIVFSIYSEDEIEYTSSGDFRQRKDFASFAFIINYGRQYILADIMSVGWHFGIGYGFDNGGDQGRYNHSHSNGPDDFPVAVSAGFTLGVLLK
ncbi:MAG: hypothetical protein RIM99_05220 [Cyclobacteriaceae bacterium]